MNIKTLLIVFLLSQSTILWTQSIGNFEIWDTIYQHSYYNELINDHHIQNPMGGSPNNWKALSGYGITRTTDSYYDDYAIILHNWYNYIEEELTYKNQISEIPTSISGYYKFIRDSEQSDSLLSTVQVLIFKQSDTIGISFLALDSSSRYQFFKIPITQFTSESPDSIQITFKNSNFGNSCKSQVCNFLYLDDIRINYQSSAADVLDYKCGIYPNPNFGIFQFYEILPINSTINIVNIAGKIVYSSKIKISPDLSHLPSGTYYINVLDGNRVIFNTKLVKI